MNYKKLYRSGEIVEIGGRYMCLACGENTLFNKGDIFNDCSNCEAGTVKGPAGFEEGIEFWKLVSVITE